MMNTIVVSQGSKGHTKGTRFFRKRKKSIVKELAVEIERLPQIEELAQIIKVSKYNEGYDDFDKEDFPLTFLGNLLDLEVRINKDNQIDEEANNMAMDDTEETDDATDLTYVIKIEPTSPSSSHSYDVSTPSATQLASLLAFEKSQTKTNFSSERLDTLSETPMAAASQSLSSVKIKTTSQSRVKPKKISVSQSTTTFNENNVIPEFIATPEEILIFESLPASATIGSHKNVSVPQSIASLDETQATPQFIATSENISFFENIPKKVNDISKKSNIPGTRAPYEKFKDQTESTRNVSLFSETLISESEKIENIRFLKQLLEKPKKDTQSKVTSANLTITSQPQSSNILVNNGSTNEKVNDGNVSEAASKNDEKRSEICLPTEDEQIPLSSTKAAKSLPALSLLTSNSKKVATVKPLPTNNPSTKDNSDDDVEILQEIIDVDKSQKKQYTNAFLVDGKIVDENNHVIGHLDPEKIKGIFVEQGITLPKGVVNYVPKGGSSQKKNPRSKDSMEKNLAVSTEDSIKKIIKPRKDSSEKKETENKDSNKREPRISLKRKTKISVVEKPIVKKRSLPLRAKNQKEDGFYKKFEEEAILNASDNDYDDPSYVAEEVDPAELLPLYDNSSSNEANGTDSNSIVAHDVDSINQQNLPSISGEIISKEGTTVIKETDSSFVKMKRAMPLSVRQKKDEEKRRRVESEPKPQIKKDVNAAHLLVPKVKPCDENIAIKFKEASSPSVKVNQELISNSTTISPTSLNKEVLTKNSFKQADMDINSSSIQSQSVPSSELMTSAKISTKIGTIIQKDGQFCSPFTIQNSNLINYELANPTVSCKAGEIVRKSRQNIPEQPQQFEMETNIALMISNVTSLYLPDEDLVDVSPTTDLTYSMVKATRADLMNNLATFESIFKFSSDDSCLIFEKVFQKPN